MQSITKGAILTILLVTIALSLIGTISILETQSPTARAVQEEPRGDAEINIYIEPDTLDAEDKKELETND